MSTIDQLIWTGMVVGIMYFIGIVSITWFWKMIDKNPVLSVSNGKMCINGKVFEHTELRESKEYLQSIEAEEALFYPENDEELDEMHEIVKKMDELSPEFSGESLSYYLNWEMDTLDQLMLIAMIVGIIYFIWYNTR